MRNLRLSNDIEGATKRIDRRQFLHAAMATGGSLFLPSLGSAQTIQPASDMPVPPITGPDQVPPSESTPVVMRSNSGKRMYLFADSDNSSKRDFVYDLPNTCGPEPLPRPLGILTSYWDGRPPADYKLTIRRFWRLIENSYTTVPAGNTLTQTVTHSWGISTTDSETIMATLGFTSGNGPGLSGSISSTFSHSVTTDRSTSVEVQRKIDPPEAGKVRVWMEWQLVDELVALDPNGKIVPEGCRCGSDRKANVRWNLSNPMYGQCGGVFGESGAWVYYQKTRWLFPSQIIRPSQRDFAI
jgi:hypothetical protein